MNTISAIQNNVVSNIQPTERTARTQTLAADTISFKGGVSGLSRTLDRGIKEYLNSSSANILADMKIKGLLKESLPYILRNENYINRGRESKVYRISDDYVAKIRRGHYAKDSIGLFDTVSRPSSQFEHLDFYYGEPLIRVGKVEILKNATPNADSIKCGAEYGLKQYILPDEIGASQRKIVEALDSLPQEAYDNFARNLKELNKITSRGIDLKKYSYIPDIINPNNLIIANGQIRLVDKFMKVRAENPNSLYTMLEPLLLKMGPNTFTTADKALEGQRAGIFKKCLLATEKENLPITGPFVDVSDDWVLAQILPKSTLPRAANVLDSMRSSGQDLKSRIEYIHSL